MTTPTPERWTAETEELVGRTLHSAEHNGWKSCDDPGPAHETTDWFVDRSRAVLSALADAGVLVAPGGETRQDIGHTSPGGGVYCCGSFAESVAEHDDGPCEWAVTHLSTVISWPDGSRYQGPWREVTDDPA